MVLYVQMSRLLQPGWGDKEAEMDRQTDKHTDREETKQTAHQHKDEKQQQMNKLVSWQVDFNILSPQDKQTHVRSNKW